MGLKDIVGKVITKYEANTSDHEKGLKKVTKLEGKRHNALIDQTEKQNKALDGHLEMWGKVAVGIGAAVGAAKLLSDGFETLQKDTALRAASVGVSIEGLRASSRGLISDMDLLDFSASAMNGTFKLTQSEMEGALEGALAIRKTFGVDLPKALEATKKAVVEGSIEPLKEFGITAQDVKNDSVEGLQAALGLLGNEARQLDGDFTIAGDAINQAAVEFENAKNEMSKALGEVAVAIAPIISGLASATIGAIRFGGALSDALSGTTSKTQLQQMQDTLERMKNGGQIGTGQSFLNNALALFGGGGAEAILGTTNNKTLDTGSIAVQEGMIEREKLRVQREEFLARRGEGEASAAARREAAKNMAGLGKGGSGGFQFGGQVSNENEQFGRINGSADLTGRNDAEGTLAEMQAVQAELRAFNAEAAPIVDKIANMVALANENFEQNNLLAGIFGTPAEIDATAQALGAMTMGVDAFTGAFGTGIGALIDGTKSFGDAFKDALGESLKSMAVEFSMQALRHGLFALGSLAFQRYDLAATHGKAAAAYGAGALVVGAAASQFGVNSQAAARAPSVGGAGAGAAGVGTVRPTAPDAGGQTNIILFDDALASMSAREREARFRTKAGAAGVTVPGAVVING